MTERDERHRRDAYRVFRPITTRWMDNDVYGHVNNVVYYAYFDTAVNAWLVEQGLLDFAGGAQVGLVVETGCRYFESISFPEPVEAGIAVETLGRSSVRYRVGIFKDGTALAAAQGHFVHVYVDRESRRPTALAEPLRQALAALLLEA